MPLNPSSLQSDLKKVFDDMKDGSKDDRFFSDEVAKAFKKYAEGGAVTTVDAGTVSAGVFAGAGTGSASLNDKTMADMIFAACQAMAAAPAPGTDVSILAPAIATGFTAMLAEANSVTTTVTGMAQPPGTAPPVPLAGQGKGNTVVVPAPLLAAAAACFAAMFGTNMGEAFMAAQLAAGATAGMAANVVNTQGQGPLAGSVGAGKTA